MVGAGALIIFGLHRLRDFVKEISRVIALYDELKAAAVPAALAVVVNVEQSSYRRIGARLLVGADGRYVGGISGGCLEDDALRRARRAIHTGKATLQTYDTREGADREIGIGLGCNGRISVLFVPLLPDDPRNEVERLRSYVTTRVPVLLVRPLGSAGSLPRPELYTTAELDRLAERLGLDPGALQQAAAAQLAARRSRVITLAGPDQAPQRLLCELLHPVPHLVVTGTNYDIPPVVGAARLLGWRTTVVGHRRKFTRALRADRLLDYDEVDRVAVDAATAVALMSHDYDRDREMLLHFAPRQPAYLGLLGPRKRALKLVAEPGVPTDLLQRPQVFAPVGLDVGAETPEEIAASLVAEILMVLRGRAGAPLRRRPGSIH